MLWDVFFFPSHIIEQMNFSTSVELNTGSAGTSRSSTRLLLGIPNLRLRSLGPVLRTALLAVCNAGGIQRSADHVIAHTGQILHTAAADEHDRMFLEIVAYAGDIGGHFNPVGKADAGYFTQRRVRLLGGGGVDTGANTTFLGAALQRRTRSLPLRR